MRRLIPVLCTVLFACVGPEPSGLLPTAAGGGPMVRWDPTAKPLPEIPFPNNSATRLDPDSPTGRRLDVSTEASTLAETKVRIAANKLDGFGTFSPLWVSFDQEIFIEAYEAHHRFNHDLADDLVYLVDVDRNSPDFGKAIPLDAGQGNMPLGIKWPWQYWDFDPHADSPNLLFETHEEDLDGDNELDPYEDIDFDGVLDHPDTWDGGNPGPDAIDPLVPFWERETNTLILYPVVPMREATTYAVVLTSRLKGVKYVEDEQGKIVRVEGEPVRSPFPYVNALDQTEALRPLEEILGPSNTLGLDLEDVSFAWTFTTQTITSDLTAIRRGLYGDGPLGWLKEYAPVDLEPKPAQDPDDDGTPPDRLYMLPGDVMAPLVTILGPVLTYPDEVVRALVDDTAAVDHYVMGTFTTPWFLEDTSGNATPLYPGDEDETFDVDPVKGKAKVGRQKATFICAVPKETAQHRQPFPVMLYGHGFSGAPFEVFGFSGRLAKYGWALCGMDAPGHGLALPADDATDWNSLVGSLLGGLYLKTFYEGFAGGRIRDLDNDGVKSSFDNGGDFWSYDITHTRDIVRQAVVDQMQLVRVLRSLGGADGPNWAADSNNDKTANDLMGDWDGNGVPDLGTAANPDIPVWGQSMGAFIAQIQSAVDPAVSASTPVSGGGGLISAGLRTINPGVPEGVWMPMMGPFVVFTPMGDGTVEVAWLINHLHREYPRPATGKDRLVGRPHYYPFARVTDILPGDTVVVRNLKNGEVRKGFRMPIPSEALAACGGDSACLAQKTSTDCGCSKDSKCKDCMDSGKEASQCPCDPACLSCLDEKASCQVDPVRRNAPECARWRGFRLAIPADALSAIEKRPLLGLKDGDTKPVPVECAAGWWTIPVDEAGAPTGPAACDTSKDAPASDKARSLLFGDSISIQVYSGYVEDLAQAKPKENPTKAANLTPIDTFRIPVTFGGAIFSEGTPLVAIGTGLGRTRNTPDFRRLINLAAMLVERGDPIGYARLMKKRVDCGCGYDELSCPGGTCKHPQSNMVMYHSVGDPNVSVSMTMALARATGVLPYDRAPRTPNDLLLEAYVPEGIEAYGRHLSSKLTLQDWLDRKPQVVDARWTDEFTEAAAQDPTRPLPLHADPDNADRGIDEYGEPPVPGYVPQTLVTETGTLALRFPYTYPLGAHGVEPSNPSRQFNINNYFENQAFLFMTSGGKTLKDDTCLATSTCEYLPDEVRAK